MGKEFKKKYMHPTRRKLVDMVQTGEYDKNTTIGYDKIKETRNVGDVWEDEHNRYEKKEGYTVKTGKNSDAFQEIRKYIEKKSDQHHIGNQTCFYCRKYNFIRRVGSFYFNCINNKFNGQ